ncbi:MAG: YraN family protein [Lachnospiraceae bacterium]|jgi:putative endonuclease|nr:YraN family protein [Lachnospiraceae bacterium]
MDKRELGRRYELFAADYLKKQGYRIVELNFCCRQGEVDIIARDKDVLVFIEVKYRKNLHSGAPAEAVDAKKQQKIRSAARYYLYRKRYGEDVPCRFDVVGIVGEKISLIRDAF